MSSLPSNCSCPKPTSRQKAWFAAMIMPFSSVSLMPSTEFSQTERNSVSELRSAISAARRSVMSRTWKSSAGEPSYSTRVTRISTGTTRPSARTLSLSSQEICPVTNFLNSSRAPAARQRGRDQCFNRIAAHQLLPASHAVQGARSPGSHPVPGLPCPQQKSESGGIFKPNR